MNVTRIIPARRVAQTADGARCSLPVSHFLFRSCCLRQQNELICYEFFCSLILMLMNVWPSDIFVTKVVFLYKNDEEDRETFGPKIRFSSTT